MPAQRTRTAAHMDLTTRARAAFRAHAKRRRQEQHEQEAAGRARARQSFRQWLADRHIAIARAGAYLGVAYNSDTKRWYAETDGRWAFSTLAHSTRITVACVRCGWRVGVAESSEEELLVKLGRHVDWCRGKEED